MLVSSRAMLLGRTESIWRFSSSVPPFCPSHCLQPLKFPTGLLVFLSSNHIFMLNSSSELANCVPPLLTKLLPQVYIYTLHSPNAGPYILPSFSLMNYRTTFPSLYFFFPVTEIPSPGEDLTKFWDAFFICYLPPTVLYWTKVRAKEEEGNSWPYKRERKTKIKDIQSKGDCPRGRSFCCSCC